MKEIVGRYVAARAKNGETLGVGSGSTAEAVLNGLIERSKKEKLELSAVTTSFRSALLCEEAGITVLPLTSKQKISWAFDGADEVDPDMRLIKGAGAAILPEKILAVRAGGITAVITEEKLVKRLGERSAVPVEVLPEAIFDIEAKLKTLGAKEVTLRHGTGKFGPVITEHGNMLLDARFDSIPIDLSDRIKVLSGVVETGIFTGLTRDVIVAKKTGVFILRKSPSGVTEEKVG